MYMRNFTDFTKLERNILSFIVKRAEKRWKKRWKEEGKKESAPIFRCQLSSCDSCVMDMECWDNMEKMMNNLKLNCILRGCIYGDLGLKDIDEELPDGWE